MSITPDQLAELEKKLSSVQNPTYSVAELCSFDELVNQLMPALIAAARELEEFKNSGSRTIFDMVQIDRDQWKERAEKLQHAAELVMTNVICHPSMDGKHSWRFSHSNHSNEDLAGMQRTLKETSGQREGGGGHE